MKENEEFIDGSWYDKQYSTKGSIYHSIYVAQILPQWAKEMNQHCADLAVAYSGINYGAKILDLGSGVGNQFKAFKNRGFDVWGVEISKQACQLSKQDKIICGSVQDMSFFSDKEFDLVYSAALFEHLDESIVEECFAECCRVGKIQIHLISQDKGHDPSHINVKTAQDWANKFTFLTDSKVILIPNLLECAHPFIIVCAKESMPYFLSRICS